MVILGLDPGTTRIGYGLIKKEGSKIGFIDAGLLKINFADNAQRMPVLEKNLQKLIKKHKPDLAVLEKLYFAKNVKTAMAVAEARGVLTFIIIKNKIPLLEYTPLEIKSRITGYGQAKKPEVAKMVQKILHIKKIGGGDDAADALAAAITAAYDGFNLKKGSDFIKPAQKGRILLKNISRLR